MVAEEVVRAQEEYEILEPFSRDPAQEQVCPVTGFSLHSFHDQLQGPSKYKTFFGTKAGWKVFCQVITYIKIMTSDLRASDRSPDFKLHTVAGGK